MYTYIKWYNNVLFIFRKGTLKLIFLINLVSGILFLSSKSLALVEVFFVARFLCGLSAGEL